MTRFLIKNKYKILFTFIIFILIGLNYIQYSSFSNLSKDHDIDQSNMKALEIQSEKSNRTFTFTLNQLKYFNDSINRKLLDAQKQLKIKDNTITSLQWYKDNFYKRDSIKFRDTIFVKDLSVDTVVGDKYYQLNLKLKYPSLIETSISITNEKSIITSTKKETVDPPNPFFLFRWFQRKQTILTVDVIDSNPYIKNSGKRYITIIK